MMKNMMKREMMRTRMTTMTKKRRLKQIIIRIGNDL
jgi:hypothetical protein